MVPRLARVVRHDGRNVHRQFADAPAVQQVDEAMVELGDEDHRPLAVGHVAHDPRHREPAGDGLEPGAQPARLGLGLERHAHEEQARPDVVELLRVEDVAALLEQIGRHGRHDPRPVGAGEGEHVRCMRHRRPLDVMRAGRGRARSLSAAKGLAQAAQEAVLTRLQVAGAQPAMGVFPRRAHARSCGLARVRGGVRRRPVRQALQDYSWRHFFARFQVIAAGWNPYGSRRVTFRPI